MKKALKAILNLICIGFIIMNVMTLISYASPDIIDPNKVINGTQNIETPSQMTDRVKTVLGIIQLIGSVFAVVTILLIGIKYITGSVESKAEYKKVMIPYLVGAILLFCTTNLVPLIYNMIQSATENI